MNVRFFLILLSAILVTGACSDKSEESFKSSSKEIADSKGTKTRCEIHHMPLVEDTIRITYGLIDITEFAPGYFEASDSIFPNANTEVFGGCVITEESPEYARVMYCPQCRIAEEMWLVNNPKPEPDDFQILQFQYDVPPEPIGGTQSLKENLKYPEKARKAGLAGSVVIEAIIDTNGSISDARILKSLSKECDEAAMQAVKSVKWKPAGLEGHPVSGRCIIPFNFRLK
jgi:TonB family protein